MLRSITPGVFYDKAINSGYFELGNAAPLVTDREGKTRQQRTGLPLGIYVQDGLIFSSPPAATRV